MGKKLKKLPCLVKSLRHGFIALLKKILRAFQRAIYYLLRKMFEGIILGIIAGATVSYLFTTPMISLKDTDVRIRDDKIDITFEYENTGRSAAVNISTKYLYGIDVFQPEDFIQLNPIPIGKIEVGEVFSYTAPDLPIHGIGEHAIILIRVRYEDTCRIRQFVNEKMFGNKYTIYKWVIHMKDKKTLSAIPKIQKDKYAEALIERISR